MYNRIDITEWLTHFIHEKKAKLAPQDDYIENITSFPDYFTKDGEEVYFDEDDYEFEYQLEVGSEAFHVLKKILFDGFLKTSWSFREGTPTIYGNRSAVCFSEMPLYGLIDYAKQRKYTGYVNNYGIAFRKKDLFMMGARPVIYGTTLPHKEITQDDFSPKLGYRILDESLGIGVNEQYRYVYTNMTKNIDWTHEREWRWALDPDKVEFPGMPFLLEEEFCHNIITDLVVIVQTNEEVSQILALLKNLYDATESHGRYYNLKLLKQIKVLAIEELSKYSPNTPYIKIENLPLQKLPVTKKIIVSKSTKKKVKQAYKTASEIYYKFASQYLELHNEMDECGFVHIITYEQTEITQAFLDLDLAETYGNGIYHIHLNTNSFYSHITASIVGGENAAKYLTELLGQKFEMSYRLD